MHIYLTKDLHFFLFSYFVEYNFGSSNFSISELNSVNFYLFEGGLNPKQNTKQELYWGKDTPNTSCNNNKEQPRGVAVYMGGINLENSVKLTQKCKLGWVIREYSFRR
jgi:hypothetical protein